MRILFAPEIRSGDWPRADLTRTARRRPRAQVATVGASIRHRARVRRAAARARARLLRASLDSMGEQNRGATVPLGLRAHGPLRRARELVAHALGELVGELLHAAVLA